MMDKTTAEIQAETLAKYLDMKAVVYEVGESWHYYAEKKYANLKAGLIYNIHVTPNYMVGGYTASLGEYDGDMNIPVQLPFGYTSVVKEVDASLAVSQLLGNVQASALKLVQLAGMIVP